jgi:ATP-binding cassette subfamily B protein
MGFHRLVREGMSRGRHSGLTGPPEIPDGPDGRPSGLGGKLRSARRAAAGTLAAVPKVIRLVWRASPVLTLGLGASTVLAGVMPAVTAYTAKLLIDAVVNAIAVRASGAVVDETVLGLPFGIGIALPTTTAIVVLAGVQFGAYAVSSLLSTTRNICQQLLQEQVTIGIQLQVMRHAAHLDLAFFEDSESYDLLRRAQGGAAVRPVMMVSGVFGLIQTAITFASMAILLVAVSPILALVAFVAPLPAFVADTRYGWRGYNLARWSSALRRRMEYLTSLVTTDSSVKEVKLFGLSRFFIDRFALLARVYQVRQRRLVTSRYLAGFGWSTITTAAGSLTYLYVALEAVAGRLTLGDLTLYTQAASSVQGSVQGLLSGLGSMYEHNLYLTDLDELLARPIGIERPDAGSRPLPRPVRGEITFEHVSFSYPDSEVPALRDVSLTIAAGETVAVVGRNGAGKSTLIKLVCRLYDPTEGRILLDGTDLRDLDPEDLRGMVAAMFQDYVTYQATAGENIGLGDVERIEDRPAIESAGEKSGASSLLGRLGGYDAPLGKWFDGGVELSGGEWQKIALGRAFMRDARILILDEPTSALDAQAEYELFARLRRLAEGRTAIYISHRFSTVRQADRILFLEDGRLVEHGTHEALMARGGRYARLFTLQASAYTGQAIEPEIDADLIEPAAG